MDQMIQNVSRYLQGSPEEVVKASEILGTFVEFLETSKRNNEFKMSTTVFSLIQAIGPSFESLKDDTEHLFIAVTSLLTLYHICTTQDFIKFAIEMDKVDSLSSFSSL